MARLIETHDRGARAAGIQPFDDKPVFPKQANREPLPLAIDENLAVVKRTDRDRSTRAAARAGRGIDHRFGVGIGPVQEAKRRTRCGAPPEALDAERLFSRPAVASAGGRSIGVAAGNGLAGEGRLRTKYGQSECGAPQYPGRGTHEKADG
jgi:hypothetical protein